MTKDTLFARAIEPACFAQRATFDQIRLDYDARFLRRKRLHTEGGLSVMVDLPETISLNAGDALLLEDGRAIAVLAAQEPLLRVTGDLTRLAWHIGNRHTPCQITPDSLLIRQDHVLEAMLRQLGANVVPIEAPFVPEGGAYGHGRTMGHDHGPTAAPRPHSHDQAPAHVHGPGCGHGHAHGHDDGHSHDIKPK